MGLYVILHYSRGGVTPYVIRASTVPDRNSLAVKYIVGSEEGTVEVCGPFSPPDLDVLLDARAAARGG